MKAFVIFINPDKQPAPVITKALQDMAAKTNVENVALAFLPGPRDPAIGEYKINTDPQVKNTVFVYKNRTVNAKFVNLMADKKGLEELHQAIQTVVQ